MKRLLIGLLFATSALAQTPVTVTGLITDAGNNVATSGYVEFDIIPTSSGIHYFIAGFGTITQKVQCGINGSGLVKSQANLANPCTVWGNDLINPANTQYKVIFAPNGIITNQVSGECITGATYSLNSPIFCPIVQISPQQAIVRANPFQTNIIPSADNVFVIGSALSRYANGFFGNLTVSNAFSGSSSIINCNLNPCSQIIYNSSTQQALRLNNLAAGGRNWSIGDGIGQAAGNFSIYDVTGTSLRLGVTPTGVTIPGPIQSSGTTAVITGTGACATITNTFGGSWAGTFKCTGATAASSVTITFTLSAPLGWFCVANDLTTRANLLQQTAQGSTSCLLAATSVTQNDVFNFFGVAF